MPAPGLLHSVSFSASQPHLRRALRLRLEGLGEAHPDTALLYNNLGCCYDMLNRSALPSVPLPPRRAAPRALFHFGGPLRALG